MAFDLTKEVNDLKTIGAKALDIAKEIQKLPDINKDASDKHRAAVAALIQATSGGIATLKAAAIAQRDRQIEELESVVNDLKNSLAVPGLDAESREDISTVLNIRRAELFKLEIQKATDFADIITEEDRVRIAKALEEARADIVNKKTAAAVMAISIKVADVALLISEKLAKAAII
jgi:ribosomal protein L29